MNLLIDIGNTRIRWAFWTPAEILCPLAVVYKGADLTQLFSEIWESTSHHPQAVYVSNVAGSSVADTLKKWVETHWKVHVCFLVSEKECAGIKNGYQKPEALGVDRWLAMIGARAHYPPPFCVMDCGSAITIDAVSSTGEHLGGLILPGLTRLQTALLEECPHIPPLLTRGISSVPPFLTRGISSVPPFEKGGSGGIFEKEAFLAKNTEGGITQGTFFMITATLKQVLDELKQHFGVSFTPIVTGGDAAYLLLYLPKEFQHRSNLVLEGMVGLITE